METVAALQAADASRREFAMAFIFPGSEVLVSSGDVLSGLSIGIDSDYPGILVESGGTIIDTFSTSGYINLDPGAVAIGVVDSGGSISVDGAVLSNTQVVISGTPGFIPVVVSSGGVAIDTTLQGSLPVMGWGAQAAMEIDSGSLAVGTTVLLGGGEIISAGAEASGTTVSSGGGQIVSSGGIAIGTTVSDGGTVLDKGVVSGASVLSGGTLVLFTDPSSSTFTVASGGTVIVGGTPSAWFLSGSQTFTLSGYSVSNGVTLEVGYSGATVGDTVSSGGEIVLSAGAANGTTVLGGGTVFLSGQGSGGVATGIVISSGGVLMANNGVASGTVVGSGGIDYISANVDGGSGGTAIGTVLQSGGEEILVAWGAASGTVVESGGVQLVSALPYSDGYDGQVGGYASGTIVQSGGLQIVSGVVSGTFGGGGEAEGTIVLGGGELVVSASGHAGGATVSSGGVLIIQASGTDADSTILGGAAETMLGYDAGTTVAGVEVVSSGGVTSDNVVTSGGVEVVSDGGTATGTLLSSGGIEVVASGGIAVSTGIVYSGNAYTNTGELIISSGGVASSGYFRSGGTEIVENGGSATDDETGGLEVVQSGGVAGNVALLDAGTLEVASGAVVSGELIFDGTSGGGSTLILNAGASFQGLVADFGAADPATGLYTKPDDQIDLQGIGIATTKKGHAGLSFTEAASNLSGTLTVTDGVHTASIELLGQYTAGEFVAASDGNGGTLITYAQVIEDNNGKGHSNAIASPSTT